MKYYLVIGDIMSIQDLKAKLQKAVKNVHIEVLSDSDIASVKEWFPTPSYDLNRVLTGSLFKGLPSKTLTLLVGPEASFKSSFMCLCAVEAQNQGYTPVIIDTEGAWTDDFVKRWGLDPENMIYVYTPWIDEIMVVLGDIINRSEDEKLCLILDSIGGLEKLKLIHDSSEGQAKADQGTLQKEIKRMLKMFLNICKRHNSISLMSGHYYGNPTGYGDADQVGGGKFTKLAPDIIISLKKSPIYDNPKAAKKDRVVIGSEIKAIPLKNRFYPPFQEATIKINYKEGIDPFAGIVDMALTCGIIDKSGSWYSYGDMKLGQGIDNATKRILEDDEVKNEILDSLEKILKTTGYSTKNDEMSEVKKIIEGE